MSTASRYAETRAWEIIQECIGPICDKLASGDITDVLANSDGNVFVYGPGGDYLMDEPLAEDLRLRFLRTLASIIKVPLTEDDPSIAATLPHYHTRVQGGVPPSSTGPFFALRRHVPQVIPLQHYVTEGRMTQSDATQLSEAVYAEKNILVIGPTGSGKTTLACSMLDLLRDSTERIITLEDQPELAITARNWLRRFTTKNLSLAQLIEETQRLRPDRVIVGEGRRGSVLLGWLEASLSAASGGMTTAHGGTVVGGLKRIEVLLSGTMASGARELLTTALDVVVLMTRRNKRAELAEISTDNSTWFESGSNGTLAHDGGADRGAGSA